MDSADAASGRRGLARALRFVGRTLLGAPPSLAWLLALAWAVLIWDLSSHSVPVHTSEVFVWEFLSNLAHAPLFGLLTVFVAAALLREPDGTWPRARPARIAAVLALSAGYGVLDELHQGRVPGRDASPLDAVTDALSACLVLWVVYGLGRGGLPERALWARLGLGIVLCVGSAALATVA